MLSRFFHNIPVNLFTQISTGIFFLLFIILAVWIYLPQRRAELDRMSNLPLKDD